MNSGPKKESKKTKSGQSRFLMEAESGGSRSIRPKSSLLQLLSRLNARLKMYRDGDLYTRCDDTEGRSYLDYFFMVNVRLEKLVVGRPIGESDYCEISCQITESGSIRRRSHMMFSKSEASKLQKELVDGDEWCSYASRR